MKNYVLLSNGDFLREDELYHWGVKGMKWGVRRWQNKDGSLTPAGKARLKNDDGSLTEEGKKQYAKRIVNKENEAFKSSFDSYWAARNAAMNTEEVKNLFDKNSDIQSAKKKLLAADKLGEEFFNNEDLMVKYKRVAYKEMNEKWGWNMTEQEIDHIFDTKNAHIWDDWDQGEGNSFQCFLKSRNIDPKDYARRYNEAYTNYQNACRAATEQMLGEYGDTPLRSAAVGPKRTVNTAVVEALDELMLQEQSRRGMYGGYESQ